MDHYHAKDLRKGRLSENGRAYLLTTVTHQRMRILDDAGAARLIVRCLREQHDAGSVISLAFVVMPDHVHWLAQLSSDQALSDVMRNFKSAAGFRINRLLHRQGPVWQHGYHDHAIRSYEDLRAVARYVVANPLRAGIVKRIGDYPWWDAVWVDRPDFSL